MKCDVLKINPEIINIEKYDTAEITIDIDKKEQLPHLIIRTNKKRSNFRLHVFVANLIELRDFVNSKCNLRILAGKNWLIDIYEQ